MSISTVRTELLKSVRGKRSQMQLSNKLGYDFNQVYRWENGRTKLPWPMFVRMCEVTKTDLAKVLRSTLGYHGPTERTDLLVKNLVAPVSSAYFTDKTKLSRFILSHWLAGRSTPSLDDILLIVEKITLALVEFVEQLTPIANIPSLRAEHSKRKRRKETLMAHPYVEAILASLELEAYKQSKKHVSGFIAEQIGITQEQEVTALKTLSDIGAVAFEKNKFVLKENILEHFDIRGDFEAARGIKNYYFQRVTDKLSRLKESNLANLYAYYTFSVDDETAAQIHDETITYFKRVIDLAEKRPKRPTGVRLLNIHYVDLKND